MTSWILYLFASPYSVKNSASAELLFRCSCCIPPTRSPTKPLPNTTPPPPPPATLRPASQPPKTTSTRTAFAAPHNAAQGEGSGTSRAAPPGQVARDRGSTRRAPRAGRVG
uniref:Uncharacterized protein n=1 Tax=Arundo donax TaxID=35708 RepID=A0A0A9ECL2_ARUDO